MKQIYNEGRVVGLSQYDLYVRQILSAYPEATPMTEREWLTSTIAENSSMILRIPSGTRAGYHDYPLPEGSQLCAATSIHASVFQGEVTLDETGYWAQRVADYGELISNTHARYPETPGYPQDVPTKVNPSYMTDRHKARCLNYLKIVSGLCIQPGDWVNNMYYTPLLLQNGEPFITQSNEEILASVSDAAAEKTIIPDLNATGFVRLLISEDVDEDILILLHGYVYGALLRSEVGFSIRGLSDRPQDGDFLGPQVFPWSSPIILSVTNDVEYALYSDLSNRLADIESRLSN